MNKNKLKISLSAISIFLIAMAVGDNPWSMEYCIKTIPALLFILIVATMIVADIRKRQ